MNKIVASVIIASVALLALGMGLPTIRNNSLQPSYSVAIKYDVRYNDYVCITGLHKQKFEPQEFRIYFTLYPLELLKNIKANCEVTCNGKLVWSGTDYFNLWKGTSTGLRTFYVRNLPPNSNCQVRVWLECEKCNTECSEKTITFTTPSA